MSLFLGKVHFWLFNKIVWFEGLEKEVEKVIEEKKLPLNSWREDIYNKYGKPTEDKPLEDMIDTSNIHGWLQGKIASAEGRQAAFITKGVNELGEGFLDSIKETYKEQGNKAAKKYLESGDSVEDTAEIFTALNNYILDGMPCDRANEILENSEVKLSWETTLDVHEDYWNAEGGNVLWFYDARDFWIEAFVSGLNEAFGFRKTADNVREIYRR
jgi:hypothetical protein